MQSEPARAHGHDGVVRQIRRMAREQVGGERNAPFGGRVGQTDQSTVGNIFSKNKLAEIRIAGDQNARLVGSELQQRAISRIGAPLMRFDDVMPLFP